MNKIRLLILSLLCSTFFLADCTANNKPPAVNLFPNIKFDNSISLDISSPDGEILSYNALPLWITNQSSQPLTIASENDFKVFTIAQDQKSLVQVPFQIVKLGNEPRFPLHLQMKDVLNNIILLLPPIISKIDESTLMVAVLATKDGNSAPSVGAISEVRSENSTAINETWISIKQNLSNFQKIASQWNPDAYLSSVVIRLPIKDTSFNVISEFHFQSLLKDNSEYVISYSKQGVVSRGEDKNLVGPPILRKAPIETSEWALDPATIIDVIIYFDKTINKPSFLPHQLILEHNQKDGVLKWYFYNSSTNENPKYVIDPLNGNISFP